MPPGDRDTATGEQTASPGRLAGLAAAALDRPRLLTLVDQGVVAAASFATTLIVGRVCGKEELGLYLVALTLLGLVMECQEVLIWLPYTYFRPRLPTSEVACYTGSALLQQVAFSLVALPFLGLVAYVLAWQGTHPGLAAIPATLLATGLCIYFLEFCRRLYFAHLEMGKALRVDLVASGLRIGGLILLAWLGSLSATRALWVFSLAGGVVGLIWLAEYRSELTFSLTAMKGAMKRHWSFGKWLLGGNQAYNLSNYAFPWFLVALGDLQGVGLLAACQGLASFVNPLVVGSRNFLLPQAARVFSARKPAEMRHFVVVNTILVGAVVGSVCLLIIVGGDRLVQVFFGPQFGGQGLLLGLLAVHGWLGALPLAADCGLWALGRPDITAKIYLVRLLATLSAGLLLVSWAGLIGAALAMLLNSSLVVVLQFWWYLRLTSRG